MKKDWTPEELIEAFSMTSEEVNWVYGATPHNVLGKAVLIKVFQHHGRFPEDLREIPDEVVAYIAQQVGMPEIVFSDYQLAGRTAERHRQTIREYLGFHPSNELRASTLLIGLFSFYTVRGKLVAAAPSAPPRHTEGSPGPAALEHFPQRRCAHARDPPPANAR